MKAILVATLTLILVIHFSTDKAVLQEIEESQEIIEFTEIIEIVHEEPEVNEEPIVITEKEPEVQVASIEYITFEMTAYTAGYESTRKTPEHPLYGVTASGKMVKDWHTIACPRSMPFGTQVYIPHFDITFTCEDRGSAITEGKLDIYIADLEEALRFGRRHLQAHILEETR
jgi:3D (Asp-Asp-Asp) domain-containing protein